MTLIAAHKAGETGGDSAATDRIYNLPLPPPSPYPLPPFSPSPANEPRQGFRAGTLSTMKFTAYYH